jgi:hypothetical protein
MSFGKKGMVPGQPAASASAPRFGGPRPATPIRPAEPDPYAAQREAFLASERARHGASAGASHQTDIPYPSRQPGRQPSGKGGHGMFGDPAQRTLVLANVYWYFCAPLGLHRIYCRSKETGLYQMALFFGWLVVGLIFPPFCVLSIAAWFIWILADLFQIPGMMRRFKAALQPDYGAVFA